MRRFWVWALGLGVAAALLATGSRISTHMTRPTGELALARALPGRKDIAAELRSERDEQSRRAAEATRVRQPLEVAVERARAISGQMQADGSPGDALQSELRDIEASTYSVPVTARIGTYIGRRGFYPVTVEGLPNGEVLAGGIRPPLTQDAAVLADGAPAYAQYRVVEGAPVRQALVFADGGAMNLRPTEWTRSRRLVSYSGPTLAATFMGSRIVTASGGGRLHVWSPETGMDTAVEIGPHAGRRGSKVVALVVSADGSVAAAARYADVLLHDGQTGRHLRSIPSKTKMAGGLSLSADGARVAFRSEWFAATVWDVEAGAEIASYKETARTAGGVALSPDGALLAAAKRDGTVGVWDIETGRRLHVLAGHTGRVRAIVFTSDAGRLITGSDDATLRVWDAVSGVETAVFKGHEMRV
ncbi:hypothetical protein HOK31_20340, partial [Candidatus Poribacteria bacterium]|nr:hypothetical protein [Candidatus Poribacteria bacterium]